MAEPRMLLARVFNEQTFCWERQGFSPIPHEMVWKNETEDGQHIYLFGLLVDRDRLAATHPSADERQQEGGND